MAVCIFFINKLAKAEVSYDGTLPCDFPMAESFEVPHRKAISSTMKIMKMLSKQRAKA
jgi:hypothetical protein